MRFISRRLASVTLMVFAVLCTSTSGAQSPSPPPLRADEGIVKTKDGCGIIMAATEAKFAAKVFADHMVWGGECIEGLAMGQGRGIEVWAYWGRPFGYQTLASADNRRTLFHWEGKTAQVDELSDDSARWPAEQKQWDDTPVVYRLFRDIDGNLVVSRKISCILADPSVLAATMRNCSHKKPFGIFQITAQAPGGTVGASRNVLCPNPRTPKGCDLLWQQMAGPYFERTRKFVADNAPKAEALRLEMPALIAAAQATALAAAQKRDAEEKRLAAESAAEVARVANEKATEAKQFRELLTHGNPGELFTLADRLSADGKSEQARETRRALIARFPDHSLAATAAAQLAGTGATGTRASTASGTNAGATARFRSVCERNWEKIENGARARGIRNSGYNDLWIRDLNWYAAKVFEPCIGASAEAARKHQRAMDEYERINKHCAGPHQPWECHQWGVDGGISDNGGTPYNNPAYYAGWKADVDRALSDPNYSADLGSAAGSATGNSAEAACDTGLDSIRKKFEAAQKEIPLDSVVVRSEAILWMAAESMSTIEAQCPGSASHQAQSEQLEKTRQDTQRTCDALSTGGACIARLPGRERAPAPVQPAPQRKPLQPPQQASCDEGNGANWLKCKQEACSRADGKLELHDGGCATCYAPGGNANWCPAGSGYNSAQ